MAMSCGCEFSAGMPVSEELMQAHLLHTMEVLIFWEMIRRPGRDWMATADLAYSRIKVLEEIEKLYPESKKEE